MTDARLPGHWLNEMRFMDLSDRTWRVFTNALMWSTEQGTDGRIPTRYLRTLHHDGLIDPDIDALAACGVLERTEDGIQLVGWSDRNGLRQSLAADVDEYRRKKRESMAALRKARRAQSVTDRVTSNVPGKVGEGSTSEQVLKASAYVPQNVAGNITGNDQDAQKGHPHEPNAVKSLKRIVRERSLPLGLEELLAQAYVIGSGDPWAGYLKIKDLTESAIVGASNPAAVLRKRLKDAA